MRVRLISAKPRHITANKGGSETLPYQKNSGSVSISGLKVEVSFPNDPMGILRTINLTNCSLDFIRAQKDNTWVIDKTHQLLHSQKSAVISLETALVFESPDSYTKIIFCWKFIHKEVQFL